MNVCSVVPDPAAAADPAVAVSSAAGPASGPPLGPVAGQLVHLHHDLLSWEETNQVHQCENVVASNS